MEQEHRDLLRINRIAICSYDFDIKLLVEILHRNKILTDTDKNIIFCEETKSKGKLLDILPKRGPNAYNGFLNAIKELNLSGLSSLLNGDVDEAPQFNTEGSLKNGMMILIDNPRYFEYSEYRTKNEI